VKINFTLTCVNFKDFIYHYLAIQDNYLKGFFKGKKHDENGILKGKEKRELKKLIDNIRKQDQRFPKSVNTFLIIVFFILNIEFP